MYGKYMQLQNSLATLALALDDGVGTTVAERVGTGRSGAATLASLSVRGPMSIERLRRILGLSHSTCVRLIQRLEASEWVQRRAGADRRTVEIELTLSGRRRAEELFRARAEIVSTVLAPLSPTELAELERLVAKLLGAITGDRASARHICRACDHGACRRNGPCPVDAAARQHER